MKFFIKDKSERQAYFLLHVIWDEEKCIKLDVIAWLTQLFHFFRYLVWMDGACRMVSKPVGLCVFLFSFSICYGYLFSYKSLMCILWLWSMTMDSIIWLFSAFLFDVEEWRCHVSRLYHMPRLEKSAISIDLFSLCVCVCLWIWSCIFFYFPDYITFVTCDNGDTNDEILCLKPILLTKRVRQSKCTLHNPIDYIFTLASKNSSFRTQSERQSIQKDKKQDLSTFNLMEKSTELLDLNVRRNLSGASLYSMHWSWREGSSVNISQHL